MNRRILLTTTAATGGMLAAAFLSTAVAVADENDGGAAEGIGLITNHITDAAGNTNSMDQAFSLAPFFQSYESDDASFSIWPSENLGDSPDYSNDALLSDVDGQLTHTSFLGEMENTNFVVTDVAEHSADGGYDSYGDFPDGVNAPAEGSVYNITDFGNGFQNIYIDDVGAGEDGDNAISDTFVTPFGNFDLDWLVGGFDAAAAGDVDPDDGAYDAPDVLADVFNPTDSGDWGSPGRVDI